MAGHPDRTGVLPFDSEDPKLTIARQISESHPPVRFLKCSSNETTPFRRPDPNESKCEAMEFRFPSICCLFSSSHDFQRLNALTWIFTDIRILEVNDIINCLFDDDGFISPERNAEVRQFSMNAIARGICAFQTSDDIGRDFTIRASDFAPYRITHQEF